MKKSLVVLSGLIAANVASIEPVVAAAKPAFSVRSEMFETLPGDGLITADTEKGRGVRWDIRYPGRQNRFLKKPVPSGLIKGATAMSFAVKCSARHQLRVQVGTNDGGLYHEIINVEPHWSRAVIPFTQLESQSEQIEGLDPAEVSSLMLIDYAAAVRPQKKGRTVWVADWKFAAGSAGKLDRVGK